MATNKLSCGGTRALATAGFALLVMLTGCQGNNGLLSATGGLSVAIDPAQLQGELHLLMDSHMADTVGTATEIAAGTQDRRVRENCLRWKMRTHDTYASILSEDDPRKAFVYAWTSAVQLRQYLTAGAGKDIFGDRQAVAVTLAQKMESEALALGRKHFSGHAIDAARPEIETIASHYSTQTTLDSKLPSLTDGASGELVALLKLPLLPVTTLEGASSTPRAIEHFTEATRDFSAIVQHLPESTRWQMELILMEMESSGPGAVLAKEMDHLQKITADATAALKTIPAEVRQEVDKSLASIEKMQPQLKATLADARVVAEQMRLTADKTTEAIKEGRTTAEVASKTADQFAAASKSLQAAAAEIRGLLADYDKLRQPQPGEKPGPSVADYRAAADSFTAAAREIRTLLDELQHPKGQQVALGQMAGEIRNAADFIMWRAIALAVTVFALALLYRLIVRRKQPKEAKQD